MSFCSYFLVLATFIVACHGMPMKKDGLQNIRSLILPRLPVSDILHPTSRQDVIAPTSSQAAGITRSQLGYIQVARVGSGLSLPPLAGITFKTTLSGSITHKGFKSNVIETFIDERASQFSASLQEFVSTERVEMQKRAKRGFFWFHQAAANYGYSNSDRIREEVESDDFTSLAEETNSVLEETDERTLTASYNTEFTGTTTGASGVLQAFAYIYINRITLDSGKIFDVVKENPELTVADQGGKVMGYTNPGEVDLSSSGGTIGENVLDSLLN